MLVWAALVLLLMVYVQLRVNHLSRRLGSLELEPQPRSI